MKTTAFHDALTAGKVLLLLGGMADEQHSKAAAKLVSRLRARLDTAVAALAVPPANAPATFGKKTEHYINVVNSGLVDAVQDIRLDTLVLGPKLSGAGYIKDAATKRVSPYRATAHLVSLLSDSLKTELPSEATAAQSLKASGADREARAVYVNRRTKQLRVFGSLVRNIDWTDTLVALGHDLKDSESMSRMVLSLLETWGSNQGRREAAARMAEFLGEAPEAKPARRRSTKAAEASWRDAAVVHVALDPAKLARLPEVRAIPPGHPAVQPTIGALLEAAAAPVRVTGDETADAILERKYSEFIAGVAKRTAEVLKASKAAATKAERAQEAKVLEALKKLGPLAQVLKRNPALLAQL